MKSWSARCTLSLLCLAIVALVWTPAGARDRLRTRDRDRDPVLCTHWDEDGDGVCDICGAIRDRDRDQDCTRPLDRDRDGTCDLCGRPMYRHGSGAQD